MADFYGTAGGFIAYWTARGDAVMAATDPDAIEIALLITSDWLDAAFISEFPGLKVGARDQIREWPRIGVQDNYGYSVPSDVPPREIENATYEGAKRQLLTPGIFFKDYSPGKYKSVSISGAVSVVYDLMINANTVQTQLPVIAAILAPILTGVRGNFSALSGNISRV